MLLRSSLLLFLSFLWCSRLSAQTPDSWTQRADFPGTTRSGAVSFSANGAGYVGLGADSSGLLLNDLWKYDPATNSWSQVSTFPASARKGASAFVIGNTAYIGCGADSNTLRLDFWAYDAVTNSWTQEQSLGQYYTAYPVYGRRDAVGLSTATRGYMICGYDASSGYNKQCWEFNPLADTSWRIRKNLINVSEFTLFGRRWMSGFTLNGKVYAGLGYSYSQDYKNDFFCYDPSIDVWTQVANYGGDYRANAFSFSLYNKGYIGCGTCDRYPSDLWLYDPVSNTWLQRADYPGGGISNGISFNIGTTAYAGLGTDSLGFFHNDFWEYTPDSTVGTGELATAGSFRLFPNPVVDGFTVTVSDRWTEDTFLLRLFDSNGRCVQQKTLHGKSGRIERNGLTAGIYYYEILSGKSALTAGKLIFE